MESAELNKTVLVIASGGFRNLHEVKQFSEDLDGCRFYDYQLVLGEKTFGDVLVNCFLHYLGYTFETFDFEGDGFTRNARMIQAYDPDLIICFGDGPLIDDMRERAKGIGKEVWVYN